MMYYRYHDPYDADSDLQLQELPVIRETLRCVILQDYYPHERCVLKDPKGRRYAYPTKELALESYIIRKERQIQHGRNTVHRGEVFLDIAKVMRAPPAFEPYTGAGDLDAGAPNHFDHSKRGFQPR